MATATKPAAEERRVHYASDHERIWGYAAIFGRYGGGNEPGWQFGVSVNKPDNLEGYDGVHDDQGRTEYNLGVAGDRNWNSDISGYWSGHCEANCSDETWAQPESFDQVAIVEVWHR